MTNHALCAHVMRGAACSPRERSARRAARDVSQRLVLPFVLLQMFVTLLFPCGALALSPNDQGVLWGPTSLGGGNSGIVVSATNNFDAALWAIGRWNTIIQLDHDKFAMLSNEGTGGHFYELASYFHSYAEIGTPNWPNAAAVEGYAISFGPANVWLASVPTGLISDARDDYNTVLNGGSLGGGSSSGSARSFIGNLLWYNGSASSASSSYLFGVGSSGSLSGISGIAAKSVDTVVNGFTVAGLDSAKLTLGVDSSAYDDWVESKEGHSFVVRFAGTGYNSFTLSNTSTGSLRVYSVPDKSTISYAVNSHTGKSYISSFGYDGWFAFSGTSTFTFDGYEFSVSNPSNGVVSGSSGTTTYSSAGVIYISNDADFIGPPLPPNNWPTDEPTPTPDPPEVPEPGDDPIVEPDPPDLPNPVEYPVSDPYTPDPDPPTNPVITYDPNPTGEPTDYRPWLNAILVLLRKINTTVSDGFGDLRGWLTNHCDHIREQIHDDSVDLGVHVQTAIHNGLVSFERWLQGTFSGYFFDQMDYLLGENFRELEGYLYDLFHWLAGQFDFTFGGTSYDDSSVLYWLRRIYARLGGGAPNPGSDGTVDDGFDWWAWLIGLITDALGGVVTDLVGDIGGFLSAVSQKFPFSIPADIALYLSLLDAPRETPVFTFVIPAIQGWWDSWEIEIDLSPYDDALSIVRSMVLIWWGFVLVLRTNWLGGVFDDGARMVTGFFDKLTGGVANA